MAIKFFDDKPERRLRAGPRGEAHHRAKLTEEQVSDIRWKYRLRKQTGVTMASLGREYGVNRGTIRAIILRKLWSHIL